MSNCKGSITICMQALSTMSSLYSMAGNCSATARGIFKSKFCDPRGSLFRDDFQALHHAGNDFVLEARIQILGVFPNENQVHVREMRLNAWHVFHWSQIGVEIEGFSQRHVYAGGT